jgi:hypothetical protein
MLTVPQIESLRTSNPQLYEALKRLAEASLGPNQGWSLDDQITDGSLFARASGALTGGKVDPAKSGVLMKGSVPPTWSGAFTYVSTTATITWSWTGLTIARADGSTTAIPNGSLAISGLTAATRFSRFPFEGRGRKTAILKSWRPENRRLSPTTPRPSTWCSQSTSTPGGRTGWAM